jgi:DNA-binding beta-propeller fold protein YncE
MKNSKTFAKLLCLLLSVECLIFPAATVKADTMPYDTYSYDWWGEDVLQPPAYLYAEELSYLQSGTNLKNPQDLFIRDNVLYIADMDNNRIVALDTSGEMLFELSSFASKNNAEDSFKQPQGVFVTEEGHIYVADSGNGRIVEFSPEREFIREIGRPQTELITESQKYVPTKVVVDRAERIYVIAYGINMGLVEFDRNGEFQGFMGATQVSVSMFEYIWKNYFSTDAQKQRMETIIPTEYSNIFVDHNNFVYATISNLSAEDHLNGADAVRRLNPTGTDVLRRLGNTDIIGDLYSATDDAAWSSFTDIAATEYGCYFILDNAGGKIFCYDYDGNSLFIFGGKGGRAGLTRNPVALALNDDQSKIYVLDAQLGSILVYEITEYGEALLGALSAHHAGNEPLSYELWQEVLLRNANSEVAYIGIGKTYLKEGNYKEAMEYFELGNSRKYYTKAFQFYRKELMQDNFGKYMGLIAIVIVAVLIFAVSKKIKRWVGEAKCNISER